MGSMIDFKSNGETASGYLALPAGRRGPGVIVVPDVDRPVHWRSDDVARPGGGADPPADLDVARAFGADQAGVVTYDAWDQ